MKQVLATRGDGAVGVLEAASAYEAVFHCSLDGMLVADDSGRYVDVNEAACVILGRTREALLGCTIGGSAEDKSEIEDIRTRVRASGPLRGEITIVRPDGEKRQVEFSAVPAIGRGHDLITLRDITHRRSLDEQIRNASKMEAIGRLAGGVAHDFNNLLMVISSYTELILDSLGESDPLRKKAQEILKASTRAAGLTRQLLAFSRKQVLEPQLHDLNSLVRDLVKLLGRVLGEDVRVNLQLAAGPMGRVYLDRSQIEQILMHLAVNARDAMPEGGTLTISTGDVTFDEHFARKAGSPPEGRYLMLAVEDTGPGMSQEVLSHLFEPFFSTKGGAGRGTGLGLAAVYGIVKQSGGYIWVNSQPAKGSRFEMYFPVAHVPAESEVRVEAGRASREAQVVLLAEDEDALRQAASDFLTAKGYRVLAARDASEALAIAATFAGQINVLVADLVMPGLSGRLLAQELLKLHPQTRIMYMSGYSDSAVLDDGVLDEACAFLRKPFRMDALSAKIREVLGAHTQGSTKTA